MQPLSLGECVRLACVWEATARKAGNVHPDRDFADLHYNDFVISAEAIAPVFENASAVPIGQTILDAIKATRRVVNSNTNLGIVLLLAPLAAVPRSRALREGVGDILNSLDVSDARLVYAAIRLAQPGGLGQAPAQDISSEPTLPLRQVMALAAERDLVARQYVNAFQDVFSIGLPALLGGLEGYGEIETAIVFCHLKLMAQLPDSLIARKRGAEEAEEASRLAQGVLKAGWPETPQGAKAFAEFDEWLTAIGNDRNPGASADLVVACLFAALRDNQIDLNSLGHSPGQHSPFSALDEQSGPTSSGN